MNLFLIGLFLISATIVFNANGHEILGYDVKLLSIFWVWIGIILWICALLIGINAGIKERNKQKQEKKEFKNPENYK